MYHIIEVVQVFVEVSYQVSTSQPLRNNLLPERWVWYQLPSGIWSRNLFSIPVLWVVTWNSSLPCPAFPTQFQSHEPQLPTTPKIQNSNNIIRVGTFFYLGGSSTCVKGVLMGSKQVPHYVMGTVSPAEFPTGDTECLARWSYGYRSIPHAW